MIETQTNEIRKDTMARRICKNHLIISTNRRRRHTIPRRNNRTPHNNTKPLVSIKYRISSDNSEIVSIDAEGNILGKKEGATVLTISIGNIEKKCNIRVKNETNEVTELKTPQTQLSLYEGSREKIVVTILPENADNKTITYKSSDANIVYVDKVGNLIAKKSGKAIITITSLNNKKTSVNVEVKRINKEVSSIKVNPQKVNMIVGESKTLETSILPEDASNKQLTWASLL